MIIISSAFPIAGLTIKVLVAIVPRLEHGAFLVLTVRRRPVIEPDAE
jgi:hypothetical protein